jgi:DMSO/TMAO reductase YedYZ molybdopterin-dependent catalytic subunit
VIGGIVSKEEVLDLEALRAYPPTSVQVSYGTSHGTESAVFVGVPLLALLDAAGLPPADHKSDTLRDYVVVTGSDGYEVVIALAEMLPAFGAQSVLLAYLRDGNPLGASGMAQLVVPGDKAGGRYVRNVTRIELRSIDEGAPGSQGK